MQARGAQASLELPIEALADLGVGLELEEEASHPLERPQPAHLAEALLQQELVLGEAVRHRVPERRQVGVGLPGTHARPRCHQLRLEVEGRPRRHVREDHLQGVRMVRGETLEDELPGPHLLPVGPVGTRRKDHQQLAGELQGLLGPSQLVEHDGPRPANPVVAGVLLQPRVQQGQGGRLVHALFPDVREERGDVLRGVRVGVRSELADGLEERLRQLVLRLLHARDEHVGPHLGRHPRPGRAQRGGTGLDRQELQDRRQGVELPRALEEVEGLLLVDELLAGTALHLGDGRRVVGAPRGILEDASHEVLVERARPLLVEPAGDRIERRRGLVGPTTLVHGEPQPLAPHAEGRVLVAEPARSSEERPETRQVGRLALAVLDPEQQLAHACLVPGCDQRQDRAQGLLDAEGLARDEAASSHQRAEGGEALLVLEPRGGQEPVRGSEVPRSRPGPQDGGQRRVVLREGGDERTIHGEDRGGALAGEGESPRDLRPPQQAWVLLEPVGRVRRARCEDGREVALELSGVLRGPGLQLGR